MKVVIGASVAVRDLHKKYGLIKALNGVTFEVLSGEYFVILGPIGSGRSTLLKCLAGIVKPDSGDILLDGESIVESSPEDRGVGYMPPGYALFPHMTVWDNVAYGLWIKGYPRSTIEPRVKEALELVGLLNRASSYPHQLSGGQRQRVALARALASGARLLLLDEPLSALDAVLTLEVRREVRSLAKSLGLTVIHVTHNQEEAMAVADKVAVMRKGRIEQVGTPEEVYFNPVNPYVARFVSNANLLPGLLISAAGDSGIAEVEEIGRVKVFHRNLSPGTRILVAIRPEAVKISREGDIKGRIKEASYMGSILRLWVEVGDTTLIVDSEPRLDLRVHDEIGLVLPHYIPVFEYIPSDLGDTIE